MHPSNTSYLQQLPSPILESHLAMIDSAIQPMVDSLTTIPSFISAALFVKDKLYPHEASTVSVVSAPNIHSEDVEFMDSSIRRRRIDLESTTAGTTFTSRKSKLEVSKINPRSHLTWGIYGEPQPGNGAVLQLAFDHKTTKSLNEDTIASITKPYLTRIWAISSLLISESLKKESLADELLMNIPATPNAYAIKWDIVGSSKMVASNYAFFRHYLQQFAHATVDLADKYSAHVTSHQGDSQDIIIPLPPHVDRADLRAVGKFGRETVLPFVHNLTILHNHIATRYPKIAPKLKIGIGLGYVEQLQTTQITGPVFWELDSLLNAQSDGAINLNQAAKIVLNI